MIPKSAMPLSREKIHHLIFTGSLFCIAGSLPYSISINSIFIIILGINWLCSQDIKNNLQQFYQNKYSLFFVSLYLCYVIGLLYSQHLHVGFGVLENKLSLLIFPLILSAYRISRQLLEKVLLIFACSCLIAVVISTLYSIHSFSHTSDISAFDYRQSLVDYFNYHPTYLSIYLIFCVCIFIYFIYTYRKSIKFYQKFIAALLIAYFLGICLLLSSRMPFISFLLISLLFIYYILYKNGRFIWIIIIVSILIGAIFILYQIPAFNQRFVEIKNTPLEPPVGVYHNSTNLRVGILICCFQVLKQNWLLGVGTGDMQVALNNCYQQNGYSDELYIASYDPHNQFIEIWLNVGITGVIVLLLTFLIPLRLAIRHKNDLYIFFLLFIMLCCMTESVLNLQKGVVFYSFFNSLFLVYTLKNS